MTNSYFSEGLELRKYIILFTMVKSYTNLTDSETATYQLVETLDSEIGLNKKQQLLIHELVNHFDG